MLLIFGLILFQYSYSQIDFEDAVNEEVEEEVIIPYDSLSNFIVAKNLKSLIGQTLFATGLMTERESVLQERFKLINDYKGSGYDKDYYYLNIPDFSGYNVHNYTKYDSIVGHYFEVIDVVEVESEYEFLDSEVYLTLNDSKRDSVIYFKYNSLTFLLSDEDFPFLIVGYYQKQKELIGKSFKVLRAFYYYEDIRVWDKIEERPSKQFSIGDVITLTKVIIDKKYYSLLYIYEDIKGNEIELSPPSELIKINYIESK